MPAAFVARISRLLPSLALAALYVLLVARHFPYAEVFEFDRDEGVNLMKASLYADGIPLYSRIWSDQPPLFTAILARWLKATEPTVVAGRLLVLLMAGVLVWAFCESVRLTCGTVAALAGTLMLVLSGEFVRLSVSVMIGLPALAMAMLSICFVLYYRRGAGFIALLISGAVFGLSLQTKMFCGFLAPLLVVLVAAHSLSALWRKNVRRGIAWRIACALLPPVLWIASAAAVFGAVCWRCGPIDWNQVIETHRTETVQRARDAESTRMLAGMENHDWADYRPLAVAGLASALLMLRLERLLPFCWLVAGYILLRRHEPVWYHHYMLLSVPLAWCAACGLAPITDVFRRETRLRRCLPCNVLKPALAAGAMAIAFMPFELVVPQWLMPQQAWDSQAAQLVFPRRTIANQPPTLFLPAKFDRLRGVAAWLEGRPEPPRNSPAAAMRHRPARVFAVELRGDAKAIDRMRELAGSTRWVFTDRPIYVFRAGLKSPPETVVITKKRMAARDRALTMGQILDTIDRYKPEQVLLARLLRGNAELRRHLAGNYVSTYEGQGASFGVSRYVRRDLLQPPQPQNVPPTTRPAPTTRQQRPGP